MFKILLQKNDAVECESLDPSACIYLLQNAVAEKYGMEFDFVNAYIYKIKLHSVS